MCSSACTGGCDEEGDSADQRCEHTTPTMGGAFEETLHGERAFGADEMVELADDLSAHGLLTEH
jgi:hypothetical protein